jgi:hypothetical protein
LHMNKMSRSKFLKHSMKAGAVVMMGSVASKAFSHEKRSGASDRLPAVDDLFSRMVVANDKYVSSLLQSGRQAMGRRMGHDFASLAAAYAASGSSYYHSQQVVPALEALVKALMSYQAADGTLNFGNLESPPDTGFLLESLSAGADILAQDNANALHQVNGEVKKFIIKAADALAVGGVHTPNHRWVICAALARVNKLYPNKKYIARIRDWLGEGVFIDADGHFPERSQNYAVVEDNSLITIARLLNLPALLEPVRKNLDMTYYYMEPNGDLVVNDSRRQDQWSGKRMVSFYLHYRYMAIKDKNSKFAGIAKLIEGLDGFDEEVVNTSLYQFLEEPMFQQPLPEPATPPVDFEKVFPTSSLLRIRRGNTSSTLFGGIDWPLTIASGRSNSPNFFSYRKGEAMLNYMRLSSNFFSMGYFYSDGLKKNGNQYTLYKKLEVPYYQPLPKNRRKANGDYKLSPSIDNRFWNKMDFENRPVSNVKTLETTIALTELNGSNELNILVSGPAGVPVTLELCFKEGGKLTGVTSGDAENNFLEKGMGVYEYGGDKITFGPGTGSVKAISGLEGERYSTHFGSLRTEGMHVYLSGVTPFQHKLTFS